MKAFVRNTILLAGLIVLDQLLKFLVEKTKLFIDLKIVVVHFVKNTGASFGILQGNNALLAWTSVIVLGLIMLNVDKIKKEHSIPLILLVSGLLGNLIDRLFRGYVIDYIDLKFWPVFNLADALIVIGVIWLIIVILSKDFKSCRKKKKKKINK